MKKLFTGLLGLMLLHASTNGQYSSICSEAFVETEAAPYSGSASSTEATEIIQQIISVIGLKPNFEVRAAKVPNAAAVVYSGKRFVLYNPNFINALNKAAGNNWASASVLAHEIGHHLNGHTLDHIGSRPDKELEADEFSGFVLQKMGASLSEAQAAMRIAANAIRSKTHPAKDERLAAIAKGWTNSRQIAAGETNASAPKKITGPASTINTNTAQSVIDERYISKDVYFKSDAAGKYYVTVRNNLIRVHNNQLYVLGKVARLNHRLYKYMIYDSDQNKLVVDANGNIINLKNQKVGLMKPHA